MGGAMRRQHFEETNTKIQEQFRELKKSSPDNLKTRLKLSWSNWGFGRETLAASAERLARNKVPYIELHGNHYGPDLGYRVDETLETLADQGLKVSGVCGMFSADNDLACNRAACRQAAIDYLDREVPFTKAVGGKYLLVVPGAVGRPKAYDDVRRHRELTRDFQVSWTYISPSWLAKSRVTGWPAGMTTPFFTR